MGAQQAELDVPLELVFGAYRLAARVLWDEVIGQPAILNDVPPSTVIGLTSTVLEYSMRSARRWAAPTWRPASGCCASATGIAIGSCSGCLPVTRRQSYGASRLGRAHPPSSNTVVACSAPTLEAERELEERWRAEGAHLISEDPACGSRSFRTGGISQGCAPRSAPSCSASVQSRRRLTRWPLGAAGAPGARGGPDPVSGALGSHRCRGGGLRRARRRSRRHAHVRRPGARPARRGNPNRRLELVATLEALLDSRSIGEAADRLGVHRHTVVYRVGRLRQLGIDADVSRATPPTLAGASLRSASGG